MSVLLETSVGDLVLDLDIDGSPDLSRNFLKLVKARYYTGVLIYNVQGNRYCQMGDPRGDGTGGASIFGLLDAQELNNSDVTKSAKRFIRATSKGAREITKEERKQKGIVTMVEIGGIVDTIGSQFLITLNAGTSMSLDNIPNTRFLSLGRVAEDGIHFKSNNDSSENDGNSTLDKINALYCDSDGRPYQDVRILKALIIHDPFPDPEGMDKLLHHHRLIVEGISETNEDNIMSSPQRIKPEEEIVPERISHQSTGTNDDMLNSAEQQEQLQQKEEKSRAIVLEMLGDLPSAEVKLPETILFVCQLNPITQEEDLELIFSRFDPNAKAELIRDRDTGDSLQYAFVEFTSKEQCTEAFLKMNNALVDDRRIKVDFSQSVSKEWNKYTHQMRRKPGNGKRKEGGSGGHHDNRYSYSGQEKETYRKIDTRDTRGYDNKQILPSSFSHRQTPRDYEHGGYDANSGSCKNEMRSKLSNRNGSLNRSRSRSKIRKGSRSRSKSSSTATDDSRSRKHRRKDRRTSRNSKHGHSDHSDRERKRRHKRSKKHRHDNDDSKSRRHHHDRYRSQSKNKEKEHSRQKDRKHRYGRSRSRSRSRSRCRGDRKRIHNFKEKKHTRH